MERHPLVAMMQHEYTRKEHEKLRKEAKKPDFELPETPTLENPDFIVNKGYVYSLSGKVQMGAVGFDTFGMGSGHQSARSLWDSDQEEVYNYEGYERINTQVMVWNNLDFKEPVAILANSLYQVFKTHIGRSFDDSDFEQVVPLVDKILQSFFKKEKDKDYEHINTKAVQSLFENLAKTTSFWSDCELVVKFVTNSDYPYTRYTATNSDYNDLIQDIHYTEDSEERLTGLYFHTGMDVRCGFSSPVFGVQSDDRIEPVGFSLYYPLEEEFGKDYEHMDLTGFLRQHGEQCPYEDQGSGVTYWLRENGWIEIILKQEDKIGDKNYSYYTNREVVLTKKTIEFINKHNPRQKKLDEFLEK